MADTPVHIQRTPARNRGNRRSLVAAVLLAVLGTVFVSLGNWQLNRADERRQIARLIETGRQAAPVQVSANIDPTALQPWQSIQASGNWLPDYSVLLDNRNLDGKPGFWLATPLSLSEDTAILVLRGWVARPIGDYNPFPVVTQSQDVVSLSGEVALRVPQLYQLADESTVEFAVAPSAAIADGRSALNLSKLPQRQNISTTEMSEVTGITFLPVVLMQTSPADGAQLQRQWPTPSVDSDTNTGYAMQWFSFAAIAFGAMGVLLWKTWRRAKIRS